MSSPVLTAPVNAVPVLFATVRARPARSVPSKPLPAALEAALQGRKQGWDSADGCGEDRALEGVDDSRDRVGAERRGCPGLGQPARGSANHAGRHAWPAERQGFRVLRKVCRP